ncbi:hypothetical protein GCM10009629_24400 [Pseudonocardia alni]
MVTVAATDRPAAGTDVEAACATGAAVASTAPTHPAAATAPTTNSDVAVLATGSRTRRRLRGLIGVDTVRTLPRQGPSATDVAGITSIGGHDHTPNV